MKLITFYVLGAIIFFAAVEARSDDKHHSLSTNTKSLSTNSTALAIASSQIHPELGTSKLQLGLGIGSHNGTAFAIGLHQRIKLGGKNALFGGTVSSGNGETGIGFGLNMKF